MTRLELLQLVLARARTNGFQFRRWYTVRLGLAWKGPVEAVMTLGEQRRYYALLFSHEFAASFWKPGRQITFQVPAQTFTRKMADGRIGTVTRKSYIRRSARENAWLYHLREMAAAEDPLRYMRRYLLVIEDVDPDKISVPTPVPQRADLIFRVPCGSLGSVSDDAFRAPGENDATALHSKVQALGG